MAKMNLHLQEGLYPVVVYRILCDFDEQVASLKFSIRIQHDQVSLNFENDDIKIMQNILRDKFIPFVTFENQNAMQLFLTDIFSLHYMSGDEND